MTENMTFDNVRRGIETHTALEKTVLVGDDEIGVSDSEAGWTGKKVSLSDLRVALSEGAATGRLVSTTARGSTSSDNGAGAWCKIATFTPPAMQSDLSAILAVTASDTGGLDSALISVYFLSSSSPSVAVTMMGKSGSGPQIAENAFKMVCGTTGTNAELWMQKSSTFGRFAVWEVSRQTVAETVSVEPIVITYHDGAPWQSSEPVGDLRNVRTSGVEAFGSPAVTAANLGSRLAALTAKTTPVDADQLVIADSADSSAGKKLTWADVKATIKSEYPLTIDPVTYIAANYYVAHIGGTLTTSAALGNETLRAQLWVVNTPVTIDRLWFEYTVAGNAGAKFRPGVWAHNMTTGRPSTLVIDGGDAAVDGTPGCVEVSFTAVTLARGFYWIGGKVHSAGTTQPTMRTISSQSNRGGPMGTSLPSAGTTSAAGASLASAGSGALTDWSGTSGSNFVPRMGFRVAP